jgi:hypothetical protein
MPKYITLLSIPVGYKIVSRKNPRKYPKPTHKNNNFPASYIFISSDNSLLKKSVNIKVYKRTPVEKVNVATSKKVFIKNISTIATIHKVLIQTTHAFWGLSKYLDIQ